MNKEQKQEVIETLKNKFSRYSNFYITDTQNLSVAQITNLRRHCFDKQVEMKVAKNTLIKKALESLDNDKYSGVYDSLHQVTALMFSDSPKDPALIISSFRKSLNGEKPVLKAAFLNGDIFVGDNQLVSLTKIKTKNELIGEVIGLLMSPIQRVIGGLQHRFETTEATEPKTDAIEAKVEAAAPKPAATEAKTGTQAVPEAKTEVPENKVDGAEPKVKVSEPKAIETGGKPGIQATPETKAEVTENKGDGPQQKVIETESQSGTTAVPVTKTEVTENKAEETQAKVKDAEPKAISTEGKSEAKAGVETKAEIIEPDPGTTKSSAKAGAIEPPPDTAKSKGKENETQPDV
jgi:large subunit ribosomal protein L10